MVAINLSLIISMIVSFAITLMATPKLIRFLNSAHLVGIDINKKEKPWIAEMGSPTVILGFIVGIFLFIWIKVFLYGELKGLVEILAAVSTILIVSLIGMFDDLSRLLRTPGRDEFGNRKRRGLHQWEKPLLTLPAAIPLMAILAGDSSITLPLFGSINTGLLYPLVLIPIGVMGTTNAMNMLAGMNGLETGLGIVLIASLGIFAGMTGSQTAATLALIFVSTLLAFLIFNWYPAKIMPGDSLVYLMGAVVASIAIIGNIEKFALFCFSLWFLEFLLKLRSGFKAQAFGVIQNDGTLRSRYDKIYSVTHIVMKFGNFTEKQVVAIIIFVQILISAAAFMIFLPF